MTSDAEIPNSGPNLEDDADIGRRLREARSYLGLTQGEVAEALGFARTTVHAMESGKRKLTGLEARRFARLYRRSVAWLLGEVAAEPVGDALFRATATLTEEDREQVLKFAQFLAAAGPPGTAPDQGATSAAERRRALLPPGEISQ